MSIRHMTAVWSSKLADPQAKMVLLKLADCADKDGVCWPSLATISGDTELHKSTVCRKIDILESIGWITRNRIKNGCKYTVTIPANLSHPATSSDSQPVALCDTFENESSRTTRLVAPCDMSHPATQPVALCDLLILENRQEPSIERERAGESESTDDWGGDEAIVQAKSHKIQSIPEQAQTIVAEYPRKEKIASALEIVAKQLKQGQNFQAMLYGTQACAAVINSMPSGANGRYIPSAESFFLDKRWQDDPQTIWRRPEKSTDHRQQKAARECAETEPDTIKILS